MVDRIARNFRRRPRVFSSRCAAHARVIAVVGLLVALACVLASCSTSSSGTTTPRAQRASYQILASYPHDPAAFTQGLVWVDGQMYESTGLNGLSALRRVDLSSGKVIQSHPLVKSDFGEGLTAVGNRLVQLTWQGHRGYVYDRTSLALVEQFPYPAEGWGLTYDGHQLISSDGSATLRFLDLISYWQTRTLTVTMDGSR